MATCREFDRRGRPSARTHNEFWAYHDPYDPDAEGQWPREWHRLTERLDKLMDERSDKFQLH